MPKLPDQYFRVTSKDDETLSFDKVSASVTSDGFFSIRVPAILEPSLIHARLPRDTGLHKDAHGWLVRSSTLEGARKAILVAMENHLVCEVVTDRLILYDIDLTASYATTPAGGIVPTAADGDGAQWHTFHTGHSFHCNDQPDMFHCGLVAGVFDRTRYIRRTHTNTKWSPVTVGSHFDHSHPANRLNSFIVGMNPSERAYRSMPYTDEAATWFAEALLAICHLTHSLDRFFGDAENLTRIQTGQLLALPISQSPHLPPPSPT